MNYLVKMNLNRIVSVVRQSLHFQNLSLTLPMVNNMRNYAKLTEGMKKKKLGKIGPIMEKKVIPVETDINKLVNYVCGSNINKIGEDIKLKPDSEYPDWLWKLNIDGIIPLNELDPNTKQYWRRLRKMALKRNNKLAKLKKF